MIACMSDLMIEIEHLHKTYRSGFTMKPKLALKDVSIYLLFLLLLLFFFFLLYSIILNK